MPRAGFCQSPRPHNAPGTAHSSGVRLQQGILGASQHHVPCVHHHHKITAGPSGGGRVAVVAHSLECGVGVQWQGVE